MIDAHLFVTCFPEFPILSRATRSATIENWRFENLFERRVVIKKTRVTKVGHGVEFREVILNGSTGEDDSARRFESFKHLDRLALPALQPMAFIAHNERDRWPYRVLDRTGLK